MSALKKVAGLIAGFSAVGVIGVAVAQGVPPNPYVTNPALGAGEQTVHMTPIGETGVLAWADAPVQTAVLTKQSEVAVVQPAQDATPVAAASTTTTESSQVAQSSSSDTSSNTQAMGAGPSNNDSNAQDTAPAPQRRARADRG